MRNQNLNEGGGEDLLLPWAPHESDIQPPCYDFHGIMKSAHSFKSVEVEFP